MNNTDSPKPTFQFRGVMAPPELFDMVSRGEISGEQAWLALVIDAYVNSRGEGCFASNETLAAKIGKEPRQVKNIIHALRGFRKGKDGKWVRSGPKLIKIVGWKQLPNGGFLRVLETKWSRVDNSPDWESPEPERGGGRVESYPTRTNGKASSYPTGRVKNCPQIYKDKIDSKDADNTPNGETCRLPQTNGNGFIKNGKMGNGRHRAWSAEGMELANRVINKCERETKTRIDKKQRFIMAGVITKAAGGPQGEEWPVHRDFVALVESERGNFCISTGQHYRNCFQQWREMSRKIEWKKRGADGDWLWTQRGRPPTVEELDTGDWYPFRGGEPVPKAERERMRKEIYERKGVEV